MGSITSARVLTEIARYGGPGSEEKLDGSAVQVIA